MKAKKQKTKVTEIDKFFLDHFRAQLFGTDFQFFKPVSNPIKRKRPAGKQVANNYNQ